VEEVNISGAWHVQEAGVNVGGREIDWQKLAASLRASQGIDGEVCGRDAALRALEIIVGEDAFRASAVSSK
jgi:hypothetical protein